MSWWFRLGQLTALALMALFGFFDLYTGLVDGRSAASTVIGLIEVGTAILTAVVWLPAHPPESRLLAIHAGMLALWSVAVTIADDLVSEASDRGSWGLAESLGIMGVMMVVARRAPARLTVPVLSTLAIALAVQPLRMGYRGDRTELISFSLLLELCAAGAVAGGVYLRVQENRRSLALSTVRMEQRAEFARDLHDFIAHHVTGIVVQAQGARMIAEKDPARAMVALEQIERAGAETMTAMRRMVGVLRSEDADPNAPLAPLAGIAELQPLVDSFCESAPPIARLHLEGEVDGLPVEISSSAYRVVMEALTNVRQHAQGPDVVDVWVRNTPNWLLVRIADDGQPPKASGPLERRGFGIMGLEERVRALGGRIQAGPGIDGGWIVDAALPIGLEVSR